MMNEFHDQEETTTAGSAGEVRDYIEARLVHIWQELLGIDSVGLDDNYFDLGGDSALTIQLFAQVERAFKVKIPLPMLFEAPTVREFAGVLRSAGAAQAVSSLVPIQPAGSRPPFFCVHSLEGDASIYRDLSRYLSLDQPFFGLQSQGVDGELPPLTTIPDMASLYLTEVRKLQAQGPYFLGGGGMGGAIALEMAQQLQRSGEIVGLLALFDPIDGSKMPGLSVFDKAYSFFEQWKFSRRTRPDGSEPDSSALRQVVAANRSAWSEYVPVSFAGAIAEFRCLKPGRPFFKKQARQGLLAEGNRQVVTLPVSPSQMLADPFVKHLADALTGCLDTAASRSELGSTQLA